MFGTDIFYLQISSLYCDNQEQWVLKNDLESAEIVSALILDGSSSSIWNEIQTTHVNTNWEPIRAIEDWLLYWIQ